MIGYPDLPWILDDIGDDLGYYLSCDSDPHYYNCYMAISTLKVSLTVLYFKHGIGTPKYIDPQEIPKFHKYETKFRNFE